MCKKCEQVKFNWQMYEHHFAIIMFDTNLVKKTDICKKCWKEIAWKLVEEHLEEKKWMKK